MATTIEKMTPATSTAQAGDAPDPTSGEPRPARPNPDAAQAHSAERRRNVSPNALIGGGVAVFVAIIGIIGALLVGQLMAINDSLGRLDTKIDDSLGRLDTKIDDGLGRLDTKIDAGISRLDTKIDAGISLLDTKIDASISRLDTKIDAGISLLDTKIDAVETSLRTEMQAGFAQINAVLLDHTERLARLEAHVGLEPAVPES